MEYQQFIDHGLSERTLIALSDAFSHYPDIESVILYGSRAKGNYREESDIDLAIIAPNMSSSDFALLSLALDELPIIYKIDCVLLKELENTGLKDNIISQGRIIWPNIEKQS